MILPVIIRNRIFIRNTGINTTIYGRRLIYHIIFQQYERTSRLIDQHTHM